MDSSKQNAKHIVQAVEGINVLLGLVLMGSPFVLGYPLGGRLTTINVVLGILIAFFATCRALMAWDARSISVINIFLGLLAVYTIWGMQQWPNHGFVMTHLGCGIGVIVFALVGLVVSQVNRPIGVKERV